MFLYNNPHIKGFRSSYEHGGEHWTNILGMEVDPSSITKDGVYFKTDANGQISKHIMNKGAWVSNTGPESEDETSDDENPNVPTNNNPPIVAANNPNNQSNNSSNNPVSISKKNTETNDGIYDDHDDAWDYKVIDGIWYTRKKNTTGEWISLEANKEATDKLNTAYPDALNIDNSTKDEEKDDESEIDNANKKVEEGTGAVYYDEEFRSPDEANLLSGVGDTGLFDLIKAIDTTAKSFKKENYYDPGDKWDYMKAKFKNTTDEDLFFDEEQFMKTPHRAGKFLIDAEQQKEQEIQEFLDQRHKFNPDKYSKVKNFDIDLYNETGHLDFRKGLFNRKHEGFQGDLLEKKYSDASHLGWTLDDYGNYQTPFDYLTQNPDDPTKFNQQDFATGFKGIPFDPNNPENYQYSDEYLNSPKHDPNIDFGGPGSNPNIIYNQGADNRFSKVVSGVSQNIEELDDPQNAMTREAMLARGMSPEEIDDILGPGNDNRYGGSIPKAQFGFGNYLNSRDGRSNLEQSLKLAGTTSLLSGLTRGLNTAFTNRRNYKNAYEDYIDLQGPDWYEEMCTTGTCPSWEENRLQLLDGHSEPNFAWFRGTNDNLFAKDIVMNKNNVLQKGDLANAYWQNVKQGVKDGLYTGAINYGLNFLGDRTKIGRTVRNWWEDKNLPTLNVGYLSRKQGGELPKFQFAGSPFGIDKYNTGFNPLTNQIDPININTDLYSTPISMDMFNNQTNPPEKTEPFFNSDDRMYAHNQSVNRSMADWDAFTADMNDKIQNPSLIQTQTSPFDIPEIEIDPNLKRDMDFRSDMFDHRQLRTDPDAYYRRKMTEIRAGNREFKSDMDDYMDDIPKYKGKRKHVRELEKAKSLGFDDRNEYLDWQKEQDQEEMDRKLRERQLNRDNREGMSFADKLWNTKNRILDSKAGQTFSKIGAGAVRIAKPLNRILESWEESKRKETMMKNAYLSDNMFAAKDADITGMKGDYDVNTGIFRPDDKVVSGTTITKYGGSFFNDGGEMEIDMNTYKQLIAAGAQIEIL